MGTGKYGSAQTWRVPRLDGRPRPIGMDVDMDDLSPQPVHGDSAAWRQTRRQAITDALQQRDAAAIKRFVQDPALPSRLREFLNTWLRHERGTEVAAAAARQELSHSTV